MSSDGPTATRSRCGLSDAQRMKLETVRQARRDFIAALHEVGGTDPKGGRLASANLTLAFRHVEDAESRAERHIRGDGAE